MDKTLKYWVVIIEEDYEESERHFFRTKEACKNYFEKIKNEWKNSQRTEDYKEICSYFVSRYYTWKSTSGLKTRLETLKFFEEEITFED